MAKSSHFFLCSTLFLFQPLSFLFIGCFTHNPPCSVQSFEFLSCFPFRTTISALDLRCKPRISQAAPGNSPATRYKINVFAVLQRRPEFTKLFSSEFRRPAQQQCYHGNQKGRKKHLNSPLPRTKKWKSLRQVNMFWYNNVYLYECLSLSTLYVDVKYL